MFPLKAIDELVFGSSSDNNTTTISFTTPSQSALVLDHLNPPVEHASTQSYASTFSFSPRDGTEKPRMNRRARGGEDVETKKATHRDIERQRRQEMGQLYASLRSLLPPGHDNTKEKHKHSLSDLMHESKNYIEKLQNNVLELGARRDKLKKISTTSSRGSVVSWNGKGTKPNSVEVNQVQDGVEILISSSSEYMLSGVMVELMGCELNVMNCVSTKIDGRFLHKIQAHEAAGDQRVDSLSLQQRLTDMINPKDNSSKDSGNQ